MNQKKTRSNRYLHFLLCFVLFILALFPSSALAAEETATKVVRVGWYEDSYHITGENGIRSGYGYEYEQAVAAYTGWDYEYVKGDWSELLSMLQEGKIDLMAAISYTDERAKTMLFSDIPMGEEKYYLYADLTHADISASDLSTLNGKRVIAMEKSIQATQFSVWEEKHNIKTEHVNADSIETAKEMIASGDVVGVISTETPEWVEAGMSAIATTGGSSIYYAINKNRPDLKEELDIAMRNMEYDKPFYADELYQRYLTAESVAVLSGEESDWLSQHGAIRIGFLKNDPGVSSIDASSGNLTGIINDYMEYTADCLNNYTLQFEPVGFDSQKAEIQALKAGDIDMIFHAAQNPYASQEEKLSLSNTVWTFNLAAITTQDYFDENAKNTVAISNDNLSLKQYVSYNYPQWKILDCSSREDAEKMVCRGEATCFITRANQVTPYIKNARFHSIFLLKADNISFAVKRGDSKLLSILNKTLKTMPASKLTGALSFYNNSARKVTLMDFIRDNMLIVIFIVTLTFAGILLIILGFLRKAMKAEAKAKKAASQSQELNKKLKESQDELKAALIQAESANSAKTTFLNNMSHDIRTPMNAIIGFTSLAASHIDNKEMVKDYLAKIGTSSEHLLSLINDVLDMSRIESGKVKIEEKPLHLPDLLHDIRTIICPSISSKQLDFLIDTVDVVDEDIIADKLRLTQILLNILSNGVKYNKTGGTISLRVKQEKKAPKGCATYHFIIRDTGIGISKEFQKHIFENFSREETATVSGIQGTGLGLSITKKIVEMMGGTIHLESEEGVGSEFDVCLTFKLSGERKVYQRIESLRGLRVLVADDDTDTCLSISSMLTEIGMRSEWTVSGKEAVIRAKHAADMGDDFYAYIIDWLMPDMNGIETVRRIRRVIGDSSPIIILTAYDWSDVEEEAREAGVTAFCEKPLFMSELRDILTKPIELKKTGENTLPVIPAGKKILLVEDNELNQEIATEILKDAGFVVDVANDGSVAVQKMEASTAGQYDLILMDIQMPVLNGYEATRKIRAMEAPHCKQIPIIAMTANAFDDDRELALQCGMNGYLAKPIQIKQMLKLIGSML